MYAEDGGGDQEPGNAGNLQKLEKARKQILLELPRGTQPYRAPLPPLSSSKNVIIIDI